MAFTFGIRKVKNLSRYKSFLLCILIFLFLGVSRFLYLGYSEYIGDELTALFLPEEVKNNVIEFLLTRRKGPMQFLISYIPFLITGDFRNELAERIPFAILNSLSFVLLFLFVRKITKNTYAGLFASLFAGTNGLTTALGRIVQYQSLNMFFSFGSLYFFTDLLDEKKNYVRSSTLGMVFFMLSFLSHWDALFLLPLILVILAKFCFSRNTYKVKVLKSLANVGLVFMIFLVPFFISYMGRKTDVGYMAERVGLSDLSNFDTNIKRFKLYNPFFTFEALLVLAGLGILIDLFVRRKARFLPGLFSFWLIYELFIFAFLIKSAGTHIYNVVIPLSVLSGLFIGVFIESLPRLVRPALVALVLAGIVQLYFQTYLIVVDHTVEYPWRQEVIFGKVTQNYTHEDSVVQNNLIGFPFARGWKQVNAFVKEQNRLNNENLGYITNENDEIAKFYMDANYSSDRPFYVIGVKRPMTFALDYSFPQIKNKHTVKKINVNGENLVRIYRAE